MASLTFFFDRCTGSDVPKLLRQIRAPFGVEYHDERKNKFHQALEDDDWLATVSQRKWIVVSHDKRFHVDSLALKAVRQHGGRVFYLDGGSLPKWNKLRLFVSCYKTIEKIANNEKPPYIYRVTYYDRVIRVKGI